MREGGVDEAGSTYRVCGQCAGEAWTALGGRYRGAGGEEGQTGARTLRGGGQAAERDDKYCSSALISIQSNRLLSNC